MTIKCICCQETIPDDEHQAIQKWLKIAAPTYMPDEGPHCFKCSRMRAAIDYDYAAERQKEVDRQSEHSPDRGRIE